MGKRFGRGQGRGEGVPSRRTRPSSGRSATPEKHRVGRGFRVFSILCRDDSYDDEIMVVACRRASFQLLHDEERDAARVSLSLRCAGTCDRREIRTRTQSGARPPQADDGGCPPCANGAAGSV